MKKNRTEWLQALEVLCDAAQRVSELWPDGNVEDYPGYLPSFDEHVNDMRDFLEANKIVSGFDYLHQAWVKDGKYVHCGHTSRPACGCYGSIHDGEPIANDAEVE